MTFFFSGEMSFEIDKKCRNCGQKCRENFTGRLILQAGLNNLLINDEFMSKSGGSQKFNSMVKSYKKAMKLAFPNAKETAILQPVIVKKFRHPSNLERQTIFELNTVFLKFFFTHQNLFYRLFDQISKILSKHPTSVMKIGILSETQCISIPILHVVFFDLFSRPSSKRGMKKMAPERLLQLTKNSKKFWPKRIVDYKINKWNNLLFHVLFLLTVFRAISIFF